MKTVASVIVAKHAPAKAGAPPIGMRISCGWRPSIRTSSCPDLIRASPQPPESEGITGSSPAMTTARCGVSGKTFLRQILILMPMWGPSSTPIAIPHPQRREWWACARHDGGVRSRTTVRLIALFVGFAVAATPVRAHDRPDPETLRSSLTEMLSFLSFGSVGIPDKAAEVTQSGAEFHIQLPLTGFAAPQSASADVVAHPAANGAWDVTSLTFPPAGALGTSIDQVVSYTIGQQAVRGRLDPQLATPSTLVANLDTITLHSVSGGQNAEQSIEHLVLDGALSGASDGRVNLRARDSVTNWHAVTRDPGGLESDSLVRRVNGHVALTDLNRAQGSRLMTAAHALMGAARPSPQQADLSPAQRNGLRAILDATTGLLTRIEADETFDGMKFNFGHGNAGTLSRMQLHVTGEAEDQRLNAGIDIAMDEFSLASLSGDSQSLVPHHVNARSVLAGIPTGPLLGLLRAATAPGADPAMLQRQATALLAVPGAQAAIESIAFDSGPLKVRGSARFVPRADGEVGADIHIAAAGVDALMVQMQGKPSMQGMLPMIFLAKGLGRAQGDSIVWDIGLGGGPPTVNGVPFGQPAGRTR